MVVLCLHVTRGAENAVLEKRLESDGVKND